MQMNKDSLSIKWPVPGEEEPLMLEPLGLIFLIFFAVVLVLQLIGMLMHRMMTLGHIVATTTIPWRKALGIHKKKKFNADALLAKKGIAMMKEWQSSYQPAEDGAHTTMESAVQDIMDKLTTGTEEEQRKYSQGLTLGNNKKSKGLNRKQTISALRQRNQTYKERKATMKGRKPPGGGRMFSPITEDDESSPHYSVSRTLTQTDPEGKTERDV
jgi:chitin synthase